MIMFDRQALQRWLSRSKWSTAIRRASTDSKGSTIIEFGLLVFPFLALVFVIMESGFQLFLTSALDHAVRKESRAIQIGAAQGAQMSAEEFKNRICRQLPVPSAC